MRTTSTSSARLLSTGSELHGAIRNITALTAFLLSASLLLGPPQSDATCSDDQRTTCLHAVSTTENWSSLVSAGECMVKQYVYFTHVCTVTNYLPTVDYCCCVHDVGLLCCRYHQGWNHFRCVESDDVVDTLESRDDQLPIEILLPSVVIPSLLMLFCMVCCLRKCFCRRYGDDGDKTSPSRSRICNRCASCCNRCYDNLCGYELAMDTDDCIASVPSMTTTTATAIAASGVLHRCGSQCHQYSGKDLTQTPSTVCTTDGHGLPYSADPASCCYWAERPTQSVPVCNQIISGTIFCADCAAARSSHTNHHHHHHNHHHRGHVAASEWPIEPNAPPLSAPVNDVFDSEPTTTAYCLPRRTASSPVATARSYRYIAPSASSASSATSGSWRHNRSFSGRSSSRSYFRSLVPGGDAFPVPPPAYEDS